MTYTIVCLSRSLHSNMQQIGKLPKYLHADKLTVPS
mgnify:CR=1 FL=1